MKHRDQPKKSPLRSPNYCLHEETSEALSLLRNSPPPLGLLGARDFPGVFTALNPGSGVYSRYSTRIFNLEGKDTPEIWREAGNIVPWG